MDANIVPAVVKTLIAGLLVWQLITRFLRRRRSTSWPVTVGTIETFELRRVHVPKAYRSFTTVNSDIHTVSTAHTMREPSRCRQAIPRPPGNWEGN